MAYRIGHGIYIRSSVLMGNLSIMMIIDMKEGPSLPDKQTYYLCSRSIKTKQTKAET